jgi:UDP-N-acetylmuramyl pentapeptide phosphotransferase/UDP-N-acetylglucosamine-1-phosphate transferase
LDWPKQSEESNPVAILFMNNLQTTIPFHGWFNGLIAFLVCAGTLPLVRYLATRWELHDLPGELKIHTAPTPRLGGVSMGFALLAGISIGGAGLFSHALNIYLALFLLWGTSLIDDLKGLPPVFRLVVHCVAGLLVAQTQWGLTLFDNSFLDTATTCIFVMLFVNAFNFFDGADGIASGVAGLVGLGYVLLYTWRSASVGAAVGWSLLGTCIGFLLFNFPPAKIFMGDSGSTVLGFLVAFLGLDFYRVHHAIGTHLLLPLVFAGLPLLDLFLAVFRRLKKQVSPFSGDRQHFYDLLQQHGWAARPIAIGSYLATIVLIFVGLLCDRLNPSLALMAFSLTFGSLFITAVRLGSLR